MKKVLIFGGIALVALAVSFGLLVKPGVKLGSVQQSSEYSSFVVTSTMAGLISIKDGVGALGSLVVSSSTLSRIYIYDAAMVSSTPTTTIAFFPTSTPVGTYTFDMKIYNGLKVDLVAGNNAGFVITYR